jgi:hypothetical protein
MDNMGNNIKVDIFGCKIIKDPVRIIANNSLRK